MPSIPRSHPALLALVLLSGFACQSSAEKDQRARRGEPEPYVPLPDAAPESIGYFLTLFDLSLRDWTKLKLSASSARERNIQAALEANMQERARKRRDELLQTLESGPPVNRRIAAVALGFTHDPTVLSPLLSCLTERDAELVQKALLGLGILALPETPPGGILERMRSDPDAWTRNNAAFALLAITCAGATSNEIVEGLRMGLLDGEPGVRAQCASSLGALADAGSVEALSLLLHDETNLVALAAASSLAQIGRRHVRSKGSVARALAGALDAPGVQSDRRLHILGALCRLAGTSLGEDAGPWLEWAHKLP